MASDIRLQRSQTWHEIHAQPQIWSDWGNILPVDTLRAWIKGLDFDEIWFCGVGSSGYIGERLGTGALAIAAREAALKVMQLSGGKIPTLADSTLGFRHGTKSFLTGRTAVTLFGAALGINLDDPFIGNDRQRGVTDNLVLYPVQN